jgi:transposase-like protein
LARPRKNIPWDDVQGIKSLLEEGKSHAEIAEIHGVSQDTISRRIREMTVSASDSDK